MSTARPLIAFAHYLKQRFVEAHPGRRVLSSCAIVFALMGAALLPQLAMTPVDAGLQYVTFFPAVTLSVVIGGFWPGVSLLPKGGL